MPTSKLTPTYTFAEDRLDLRLILVRILGLDLSQQIHAQTVRQLMVQEHGIYGRLAK